MPGSMRLGFLIAAFVAMAFLAFSLFGTRHETWFVRAAQESAVRCLTSSPCTRLTTTAVLLNARPPLGEASACAKPNAWQQVTSVSNGQTRIVLTCSDGKAYLYHMGTLAGVNAGNEQWMACAEPSCRAEARRFAQ